MKIKYLLYLLPGLLLSGCISPFPAPNSYEPPVIVVSPHHEVDELLAYHQKLLATPRTELGAELDGLFSQPKGPQTAIRKAMVLVRLGRRVDLSQAQAELQSVLNSDTVEAQNFKPLAQLLATHSAKLQSLAEQAEKTERQLADSQQRVHHLSQALEELKAIERALPSRMGGTSVHP